MASTATPYGLRPVRRMDGLPYAGATTEYLIDPAGEATNIYSGQIVILGADGYIAISTATGGDVTTNNLGGSGIGAIGVFMGCEYVNAQGQVVHDRYYPTGYAAPSGTSIKAYVVDDPNVLFQCQLDSTGAQTVIGTNTFLPTVQSTSTGSTSTGQSNTAFDATVTAATSAFRIVAHVSPTDDSFVDVLVKFNPGYHSFNQAVGL